MTHRLIRLLVVLCLTLPSLAFAENTLLPARFDVTGVAANDVLNVRVAPNASAEIIGSYDHIMGNIEVLRMSENGKWGLVNMNERTGWTSMRYLARQPGQTGTTLPRPLFCGGTEPFWNMLIGTADTTLFDVMGDPTVKLTGLESIAQSSHKYAAIWSGDTARHMALITRQTCNDGMSDREFGFSIDFLVAQRFGQQNRHSAIFSGCCSLSSD